MVVGPIAIASIAFLTKFKITCCSWIGSDPLPLGVRFAQDMIGPAAGATWGLGSAIRTGTGSSVVPGSTGSFAWSGVWGTSFWVDPVEKLIAVQMIQVNPEEARPYRALGDLI